MKSKGNFQAWAKAQQRSILGNRNSMKKIGAIEYNNEKGGNNNGKHSNSSTTICDEIDRRGI